jgi:hypothetical protein
MLSMALSLATCISPSTINNSKQNAKPCNTLRHLTCIMLSIALSLATEMVRPRGSKLAWLTQLATMPLQGAAAAGTAVQRQEHTYVRRSQSKQQGVVHKLI